MHPVRLAFATQVSRGLLFRHSPCIPRYVQHSGIVTPKKRKFNHFFTSRYRPFSALSNVPQADTLIKKEEKGIGAPTAPSTRPSTNTERSFAGVQDELSREPTLEQIRSTDKSDKPGVRDDEIFPISDTVKFWRSLPDIPTANNILSTLTSTSTATAPIWAYSILRATFYRSLNILMGIVRPSFSKAPLTRRNDIFSLLAIREMLFSLKADVDRIDTQVHKMPWDSSLRHRQFNPMYTLERLLTLIPETFDMLNAMKEQREQVVLNYDQHKSKNDIYPNYYLYNFHYQPKGWLSSQSAKSYDLLTEILFSGRQDAMQRATFHSFNDIIKNKQDESIVEIAAGTGRFATFVRDNYRNSNLFVTELSPYFLEEAKDSMKEWSRIRQVKNYENNTQFVQANAERLPFDDASMDIIYSVYLFHELPPHARKNVIKEAARVLKTNGHLIITDSVQLGDRHVSWDKRIGSFSNMNEPWYGSYISTDFGELVTENNLFEPVRKDLCSATKSMLFRKMRQ